MEAVTSWFSCSSVNEEAPTGAQDNISDLYQQDHKMKLHQLHLNMDSN